jgi:CubicO group peptidase (beta-lactamase class C family)
MKYVFPGKEWEYKGPEDIDFSPDKLANVESWLKEIAGDTPFRLVITRYGYLIAEWYQDIDVHKQINQSSAGKSYYSCILGIAAAEGKIPSPDVKVVDYYPEMMEVGEDEGPKPGRHAFEKDRNVTFRQLICNTSGYMKPGEEPAKVFHYQTYGMNILTNSIASIYGLYDSRNPDRLPGCAKLIEDKIRDPIEGTWSHFYTDFKHPPGAKKSIFGHSLRVCATARDTARAGHLWLNWGKWNGVQVIPEGYLKEATVTNPDILANEPEEKWKYGHGFWVNDYGKQWPDVPRDSFAASGAGAKLTWICPSLGIVVSQNTGIRDQFADEEKKVGSQNEILARIIDAVRE